MGFPVFAGSSDGGAVQLAATETLADLALRVPLLAGRVSALRSNVQSRGLDLARLRTRAAFFQ
jgi:hypothetical protein